VIFAGVSGASYQFTTTCSDYDCIPALGEAGSVSFVAFLRLKSSNFSVGIWDAPLKKIVSLSSSLARFSAFAMRIFI
jgi:hypothetical protein